MSPLSMDELSAESAIALPAKEVLSLLDLNVNLDLGLDLSSPIDLAVAANANVVAPIDAAVGANVLSTGSTAETLADQGVQIDQYVSGDAIATAPQVSNIDQSGDETAPGTGTTAPATTDAGTTTPAATDEEVTVPTDPAAMLDGDLLKIKVDVSLDADVASPIAGAVAANANVAAPIDASVAANVASADSTATAISQQDAIINQRLEDVTARATADQQADIEQ
jgi:hypothetical protein